MRLQDKVAIVTGGGRGIGIAYARRFLAEGARVMIADVSEDEGRAAAEELLGDGDVAFVATDIADQASTRAAVDATVERFGTVDVLLNNAAIYGDLVVGDQSLEYLKRVFDVNVHGQWLMAKSVAPHLVRQRWGRIVNVASIAAYLHVGSPASDPDDFELDNYAYKHSKFAVLGLTRHMAGQLGQYNVTVNCIAPGLTNTAATNKLAPAGAQSRFEDMSAMHRNPEPEHMVGAAVFFASSDADLVNGQILVVDGGNVMPV